MSSPKCNCCLEQDATRMCFSCDPSGKEVYMCGACNDRAHFGPMKLSHHVKSTVNMAAKEQIAAAHKDWSAARHKAVMECIKELKACVSDLEYQKRVDLDIMSAAFDPLKNAVVNRKRELSAQIVSHYDKMKPTFAEVICACENRLKIIDSTAVDIDQLSDTLDDEEFALKAGLIKSQMTEFQPSTIKDLLPAFSEGHRTIFPPDFNLAATIQQIKECKLTASLPDPSEKLNVDLTLQPGDVVDVTSSPMDSDGVFWLKRNASPECFAPLSRLSFDCRQKLILGEKKRYSECPQDLHTGLVVMANLPDDGVWRRAVVADPCVKDKSDKHGHMASVILLDTGYKRNLYHERLAVCCNEALTIPFHASQCSLYPGDHQPVGAEPRWLFNDLVMEQKDTRKVLQAKFVHKKKPAHAAVPVWYVELIDQRNPSLTFNQMIEEKRLASSIAKGSILHKDIRVATGEVPPPQTKACSITKPPASSTGETMATAAIKCTATSASDVIRSAVVTTTSTTSPTGAEEGSKCEPTGSLDAGLSASAGIESHKDTQPIQTVLPPPKISEVSAIIIEGEPVHNSTRLSSPESLEAQVKAGKDVLPETLSSVSSAPKVPSPLSSSQAIRAVVIDTDGSSPLSPDSMQGEHASLSLAQHANEASKKEHANDSGFNSVSKIVVSIGSAASPQTLAPRHTLFMEEAIHQQEESEKTEDQVDSTTSGASGQNGNSGRSSFADTYEGWQEPSNSSALSTQSDEYVQKKHKKKRQRNSKRNGCSTSDTVSDPGSNQHVSQAARGDDCAARLAKVIGQNAIRNWIQTPGRLAYGLPTLTDVGAANPGNTLNTSVNTPPPEVDSSTEVFLPTPVSLGEGDGTQVDVSGWIESVTPSQPGASSLTHSSQPNEDQGRNKPSALCFACREAGHVKRNCPWRERYQRQPCLLCTEKHTAEECEPAKKIYFSGGCPYCLTIEHKMTACTNFKKPHLPFKWLPSSNKFGRRGGH